MANTKKKINFAESYKKIVQKINKFEHKLVTEPTEPNDPLVKWTTRIIIVVMVSLVIAINIRF